MHGIHQLSKLNHDDLWYLACPHFCNLDISGYTQISHVRPHSFPQADFLDCDLSKLPEIKKYDDCVKPPPFEVASNQYMHSQCYTLFEKFGKQQDLSVLAVISLQLGLEWR